MWVAVTFSLRIIGRCVVLTINSVVKKETHAKFPNYVPSSKFDGLGDRFLPGGHLDDLNARHTLVHQPLSVVCPYRHFLPLFRDRPTEINCNKITDKLVTNVFFYRECELCEECTLSWGLIRKLCDKCLGRYSKSRLKYQ